jgi:hypothetical protein
MKDRLQVRFENDPNFRAMVTQCEMLIETLQLTPSELREAVMFAALRYDMRNPQPIDMRRNPDGNLEISPDFRSWLAR